MAKMVMAGWLLLSALPPIQSVALAQGRKPPSSRQKVFTDWGGVGKELVIDVYKGRLRLRRPTMLYTSSGYLVDGLKYYKDRQKIEANYQKYEARNRLRIQDGTLYYDQAAVTLPSGVQMRDVWQAMSWEGWIICLGRTSKTDKETQLRPPFFAAELITFSIKDRVAQITYLNYQPPPDIRLYILDPQ